jgi:hypothetical protein
VPQKTAQQYDGKGSPSKLKLSPGPKGFPLFGSVFEPKGDTIGYLTKCTLEYGDIVFFRFLGVPACYISRPEYIESILVTQSNNFVKSKDYRAMRRVLACC